ncbi:MAG TPA: hypothetical protein HA306_01570 [Methanosarcina sp.]|nr:hypothetical protein [Methanosarcina sp.]
MDSGNYTKKFEYKCVPILKLGRGTAENFNIYGSDGWELACVWASWQYLNERLNELRRYKTEDFP